ncbi:IS3 family transposase [Paenibacillus motobuensis]|nr:IS3 family transposase [Paenibacillus lutimineralis]MCM3647191.1 IS3 family transposase [Paenibacillus motobuensis]
MNAYIESFHNIIEKNLFSQMEYMTMEAAYESIDNYIDFYNNRRMHGSLKRMSPLQFSRSIMQFEDRSMFYRTL